MRCSSFAGRCRYQRKDRASINNNAGPGELGYGASEARGLVSYLEWACSVNGFYLLKKNELNGEFKY